MKRREYDTGGRSRKKVKNGVMSGEGREEQEMIRTALVGPLYALPAEVGLSDRNLLQSIQRFLIIFYRLCTPSLTKWKGE